MFQAMELITRFSPKKWVWKYGTSFHSLVNHYIHIHSPWYDIAITWWICSPFITQIDPCFMQLPGRSAQAGRKIRSKVLTIGTNEAIAPCHGSCQIFMALQGGQNSEDTHRECRSLLGYSPSNLSHFFPLLLKFWAMGSRNMSLMRWHTAW